MSHDDEAEVCVVVDDGDGGILNTLVGYSVFTHWTAHM